MITLPRKGASSQVEALLHVVFPDTFEPIVSVPVKQKIAAAFSEFVDDLNAPLDDQLALIRASLAPEHGDDFSFYDPIVREHVEMKVDLPVGVVHDITLSTALTNARQTEVSAPRARRPARVRR